MIPSHEKTEFQRVASLAGWDIAKHFRCSYVCLQKGITQDSRIIAYPID